MSSATEIVRADHCVVALAEAFRGDGEIFASPMGNVPMAAGRLARATFEPDLLLTDGIATAVQGVLPLGGRAGANGTVAEAWMPFRKVFDTLWWGRRHVVMGASQIDRFGNQNISCVGSWETPKAMLLGMRGAPGNTINHTTSYWIPNHSPRVFVEDVDVVCGVGYDRASALGEVARFHEIRRVVTNLGVLDFETPDHTMRLRSAHPGVSVEEVVEATGFELVIPDAVPVTRDPTPEDLDLLRRQIDPDRLCSREVPDTAKP